METRWPVVTVRVPPAATPEQWEIFCALAGEEGCAGYVEFSPAGEAVPLSADFAFGGTTAEDDGAAEHARQALAQIAAQHLPAEGLEVSARLVADEMWTERWREFYFPTLVTPHLAVGPPDGRVPEGAAPDALYLRIELGSAFGTGNHESTRGCLAMIDEMFRSPQPARVETFLDMGTGTGVLSFAALRLGCRFAVGIDADHHAEPNFVWNAELNALVDRAFFVLGSTVEEALAIVRQNDLPAPKLIACNMIARDFDPLLEPMRRLVPAPMILSGLLHEEADAVRRRLVETGWKALRELTIGDWDTWHCVPD